MAFRLKLKEPLGSGFTQIGLDEIERAIAELRAAVDRTTAIHQARKAIKRIRSMLRLARAAIGEEAFRRENARFRDIAQLLASQRDAAVLAETLAKLEARYGYEATRLVEEAGPALVASARSGAHEAGSDDVSEALLRLEVALSEWKELDFSALDLPSLQRGFATTYGQAQRWSRRAFSRKSDEAYHDWRKWVQRHWRQLSLVEGAWPLYFAARIEEAKELSDILGDDHDLSVLIARLEAADRVRLKHAVAAALAQLARRRQKELRQLAKPHGDRLFAYDTAAFADRLGLYWQSARRMRKLKRREEREAATAPVTPAKTGDEPDLVDV